MTQKWLDLYPTITLDMWYYYIMLDETMILSEPDDMHLTVFNPDDKLLGLIKVFMNKHKGIEKLGS